jgi:hypothetical protein
MAHLWPCVLAVCIEVTPDSAVGQQAGSTVSKPGDFVRVQGADCVGLHVLQFCWPEQPLAQVWAITPAGFQNTAEMCSF